MTPEEKSKQPDEEKAESKDEPVAKIPEGLRKEDDADVNEEDIVADPEGARRYGNFPAA